MVVLVDASVGNVKLLSTTEALVSSVEQKKSRLVNIRYIFTPTGKHKLLLSTITRAAINYIFLYTYSKNIRN